MKYVKPTVQLALITASAAGSGTCEYVIPPDELEMYESIFGVDFNAPGTFNVSDGCETALPLEQYCKFTSNDGVTKAFVS